MAFLRPVLDWVNAAYWQWGIWVLPNIDQWLRRGNLNYTFADDLETWKAIPNVTLHVRRPQPDAVENDDR